ncbi:MAG: ACP S-malonyltransferase [Candidatus Marinimicrobia bacterium]|nr:ACP S-malonyltransferase [Candidatus Neomarinimicrobiota bacterium]
MSKIAFIFPGQASQYVGMGIDFYNKSKIVKKLYDCAEEKFNFSLKEISFYGSLRELTETRVTQPAIFVLSVAIFQELKYRNIVPDMVAGHSLGEYSAIVAAGCISFEEGLELVKIRSEQMQIASEKTPGTMAAVVGLSYNKIKSVLSGTKLSGVCTIANYNSPVQLVISGDKKAIQNAMLALKNAGAKRVIELSVGGAFHSPLMEPAFKKISETIDSIEFKKPEVPIYMNATGLPTQDVNEIKQRLKEQLTSPVLWTTIIENMVENGAKRFLEVGPGKVLQGLVKRINPKVIVKGVGTWEELENFKWEE